MLTGVRKEIADVKQSFRFKAGSWNNNIYGSRAIYTSVKNRSGNVSKKELEHAREMAIKSLRKDLDEMRDLYQSALNLGLSVDELRDIMKDSDVAIKYRRYIEGLDSDFDKLIRDIK